MELSVVIYEEITGQPELPAPVDAAEFERRKHTRVPFGHRATITTQRKGVNNEPCVVMVRDVSIGGLSFLNAEVMKPGTPFLIEFRGHRERTVKFRCMTQRCEAGGVGGTQFVVGATFEKMLTEELPAAPQQKEEEQHVAVAEDPGEDIADIEIEAPADQSGPGVDPDIEAAIAAALDEAAGPNREVEPEPEAAIEPEPEPEKAPEPVDEPLSQEDQQKLAARLKHAEPQEEKKPLVVPSAAPAPKVEPRLIIPSAPKAVIPAATEKKPAPVAAPAKQSGLFISSGSSKPKLQFDSEWATELPMPQQQQETAQQAPPPAEEGSVFRVIMLPDPPAAQAAEMELGPSAPAPAPEPVPAPAPVASDPLPVAPAVSAPVVAPPVVCVPVAPAPAVSAPVVMTITPASDIGGINGNDVLARVKEVLLNQEKTIKAQRQQIKEDREKTNRELESLRTEMAAMQRKLVEIQARKSADDRAIADLAAVLATCEQDGAEPVKPQPEATKLKSEAA